MLSRSGTETAGAARKNKTGAAMKHASTRRVYDYWNEQRGNRVAPERSEIDPGAIRHALGDTFILALDPVDGPRFRLAGTKVCALFCRELKGEAFINLWSESERRALRDHIAIVAGESAAVVIAVKAANAEGLPADLELLLLPLMHRDHSQARLLGVLAPLAAPYWLGATPVESLACGTWRHLTPAAATIAAPRLVPASDAPALLSTADARVRHGLVIYDGGRS
jgi:hypothetical protein